MSSTPLPFYTAADITRELDEGKSPESYRTPWRKDYARLVHSPSFRRLQGKTQLFPGESDFFRNRLTHSLEVAQIAKSITIRLNNETPDIKPELGADYSISTDLVEFAALAHDLGHPPFGHNGEAALDECMSMMGGYEGNAQTIRILSKIEKKRTRSYPDTYEEFDGGRDIRLGLNLTHRTLAATLKYDDLIPIRANPIKVHKGYYSSESELVHSIRRSVLGKYEYAGKLNVVECQIMDIADDIAYSTYDLEDAMKAGFTSPLDFVSIVQQDELLTRLAITVWKRLNDRHDDIKPDAITPELRDPITAEKKEIVTVLFDIAEQVVPDWASLKIPDNPTIDQKNAALFQAVALSYRNSKRFQYSGYLRTSLTSDLVGEFISAITLEYNPDCPALSKVKVEPGAKRKIEILKNFTYEVHILAARLKTVEFRGKEIVRDIFSCLQNDGKNHLLPTDWRGRCESSKGDENERLRNISDFVAGMTDRYALEFYQKLHSTNASTIYREDG